jgi:hypothetical protein
MTDDDMAEQPASRRYLEANEVEALYAGLDAYQEKRREQRRQSHAHGKSGVASVLRRISMGSFRTCSRR